MMSFSIGDTVICCDDNGLGSGWLEGIFYKGSLTVGKEYNVLDVGTNIMDNSQLLIIINDKNESFLYSSRLFRLKD